MKTINRFIIVILLVAFNVLFGCAPEKEELRLGTIYGTVSDYSSGEPISNTNVRLNPRGETTLTGMDGTFQFNNLPSGSYSLSLSKNGYLDLDDDYVIKIENGNMVQRAIQMQKQAASLQIVDNNGDELALMDFGVDEGVSQKTFNIFNDGNMTLEFTISKTVNWIEDVLPPSGKVSVGDTKPIMVIINRALLTSGENRSTLLVTTPTAGGVEIVVKATVPFVATVETGAVTEVGSNSAKCAGKVLDNGGVMVTDKGICYSVNDNPTIDDQRISGGPGVGSFLCTLTGLEENETYYVCAYAVNSMGVSYGIKKSFTTQGRPVVSTVNVSNVSANRAQCSGNVSSEGGSPVSERGVCYGLAPNPTINNDVVKCGTGTGSFTCDLPNLSNNTTYYVKAYAKNSFGVAYGEEMHFTTELFPIFQYGGHTYQVAPDPGNTMVWYEADSYCKNISINGLSGWRLPSRDELVQMYADRQAIGGFSTSYASKYWSSSYAGQGTYLGRYYFVNFYDGSIESAEDDYYHCSVRPIRIKE